MQTTETIPDHANLVNSESLSKPRSPLKIWIDRNLLSIMGTAAGLSVVLFGGAVWNTWNAYQGFETVVTKQFKLRNLSDEIVYLDEVLTMSARMAASTGNPRWKQRYDANVSHLDQVIDEISRQAPSYKVEAQKTDAANQRLIQLEEQSFALVDKGEKEKALDILTGNEYESQKNILSNGVRTALDRIERETSVAVQNNRSRLLWSLGFAVACVPVLLLSWSGVLWAVREYIRERDSALRKMENSQLLLLRLNKDLEEKGELLLASQLEIRQENDLLQEDVGHLLDVVSEVEQGDLRIQANVNERVTGIVADTLNRLIEELGRVLFEVFKTAVTVRDKGSSLVQFATRVTAMAQGQSDAATEVLALSESIEKSVLGSSEQVQSASETLERLTTVVLEGRSAIVNLSDGIGVLQGVSERIVQQMKTLGEFVGLADQFVSEQGDIAQQTQVLALNASLVAARATGSTSREALLAVAQEFEGIADQVSHLAMLTSEALAGLEQRTRQIHAVVSNVDAAVQGLGSLVTAFGEGVRGSTALFEVVESAAAVALSANEAVRSSGSDVVAATASTVKAMEQVASNASETADITRQSLAAAQELGEMTSQLLVSIGFFRLPLLESSEEEQGTMNNEQ